MASLPFPVSCFKAGNEIAYRRYRVFLLPNYPSCLFSLLQLLLRNGSWVTWFPESLRNHGTKAFFSPFPFHYG
jgi:hypothetical protein